MKSQSSTQNNTAWSQVIVARSRNAGTPNPSGERVSTVVVEPLRIK